MSPYLAVLGARIRVLLQYRAAAIAGLITQFFWGGIRGMVFMAFYRSTTTPQPMNLADTISYLWLTQALLLLLPFRLDADLRAMMRDGTVAYELARPTDLYWLWYARSIAQRFAPALLRAVPLYLIAWLFLGLQLPPNLGAAAAFGISLMGALFLSAAISTLMSITMLWTISGEGIWRVLNILALFLSGSFVPLPLFPDWSQPFLAVQPFGGIMDTPFRLYVGHLPASGVLLSLGHQLIWTALFVLAGRLILTRGLTRLVVQGG
jgi:ABC-2 type transport system permease protein